MNAADAIIALGTQLSDEKSAAHDLWTWLPSYKVAEKNHGDYASEFAPCVKDIMAEAAMFIAAMKDPSSPFGPKTAEVLRTLTPDETDWFMRCPCEQDHVGE